MLFRCGTRSIAKDFPRINTTEENYAKRECRLSFISRRTIYLLRRYIKLKPKKGALYYLLKKT